MPDSFASAANFLRSMGWKANQTWGREVMLPDDFEWEKLHNLKQPLAKWVDEGIKPVEIETFPLEEMTIEARLLSPQGADGPFI